MRMRKKKHLDERMAQCADYLFSMQCDDLNALTAVEKKEYIDLPALFGNNNPVVLEIGCGKGRFACELARREPAVNVLALEKARNACTAARNTLQNICRRKAWIAFTSISPVRFPKTAMPTAA